MNKQEKFDEIGGYLQNREFNKIFELLDIESNNYLSSDKNDLQYCIELINLNQNLLEYMGASKQYEMAFDLHNTLIKNRNSLFIKCISDKPELITAFKNIVGDFS